MTASFEPWLLLGMAILLDTAGSILFKHGVNQLPARRSDGWRGHLESIAGALRRKEIALGVGVYVLESIAWLATLSYLPLNTAFSLFSFNNISILLASRILLGERISRRRWSGVALIVGGILLVVRHG